MEKSVNRFVKIYPWYFGMVGDLLFFIAIDTLFLDVVKKFSAAEIVSLTSFSLLACLLLQVPMLLLMKRIGNTASIRVGAFLVLLAAVFITFGNSYFLVLLGKIFHSSAILFKTALVVALENNLDLVGRRGEFVNVRTSAYTLYSLITLVIALVVAYMFNWNHYFPMLCSIATSATGFVLSLFMRDCSPYDRVSAKTHASANVKIRFTRFVVLAILANAVFWLVVGNGQGEGKLFLQQNILLDFSLADTTVILMVIVSISRIARVFANLLAKRLYTRYLERVGVMFTVLLSASIGLILFGSFVPSAIVRIAVMGLGYIIILFARDPFELYIQDIIFMNTPKEQHQSLNALRELFVKIVSAGVGLIYSAILLRWQMSIVMTIVFATSLVGIVLVIKLRGSAAAGKTEV